MANTMALFDLDGTLSHGHVWWGFLKYLFVHKKKRAWILSFWARHFPLYLLCKLRRVREEEFRAKWAEDLGGIFEGAGREEVLHVFQWVDENCVSQSLRSDIVDILNQHKRSGRMVVLISGNFDELLEIVGRRLGVTAVIGTRAEVADGVYTGRVIPPVCFGRNKVVLLEEFIRENGLEIDFSSSFAYADSFLDSPLLKLVGNPVATYPDKELRQFAEHNAWQILC